jgi:hypothetical protein
MFINHQPLKTARRNLVVRPRAISRADWPDFKIRPISEEWQYVGRVPAYRTMVANVAYIWRDSSPVDRLGPMPRSFEQRRFELQGSGLALPASAPLWASADPYQIWQEADEVTAASGNPADLAGWHVMMEIPKNIQPEHWRWMVTGFVHSQFVSKGAAVAWAIHSLEGCDGDWIIAPHVHLIVSGRHWRHDYRRGRRHPNWIASWAQQKRMEFAWRRRCARLRDLESAGFAINDRWPGIS